MTEWYHLYSGLKAQIEVVSDGLEDRSKGDRSISRIILRLPTEDRRIFLDKRLRFGCRVRLCNEALNKEWGERSSHDGFRVNALRIPTDEVEFELKKIRLKLDRIRDLLGFRAEQEQEQEQKQEGEEKMDAKSEIRGMAGMVLSAARNGFIDGSASGVAVAATAEVRDAFGKSWPKFFSTEIGRALETPVALAIAIVLCGTAQVVAPQRVRKPAARVFKMLLRAVRGTASSSSEALVVATLPFIKRLIKRVEDFESEDSESKDQDQEYGLPPRRWGVDEIFHKEIVEDVEDAELEVAE